MMNNFSIRLISISCCSLLGSLCLCFDIIAQTDEHQKINEHTPSKAQYSTWINNTNEGANEKQTLINLDFFAWLNKEYGMKLDIYAFDAGLIDGKNFYGSMKSDRFTRNFPNGLKAVSQKAKDIQIRFGCWGGPDGFGNTQESAELRKKEMISLCKDYEWALFKFDAVCGQLRTDKVDDFVEMMEGCRQYSPDLIVLNHRLKLGKGMPYTTTFLWEGQETYIDVFTSNRMTAPHNRAGALMRGLPPEMKRLVEDCGVCLSSCLDYWDDDLVLQAFNRSMILAPQIYGNPWFLSDKEFPKLARIYNLHRKFGKILTNAIILPESYGLYPVSRGDASTRLITLRNLEWTDKEYSISLDDEIGLIKGSFATVRLFHPVERIMGIYKVGEKVKLTVPPFRSALLYVSTNDTYAEPGVEGVDFEVVKNIEGQPVEINLLGMPGTDAEIRLPDKMKAKRVLVGGNEVLELAQGKSAKVHFEGELLRSNYHRRLAAFSDLKTDEDVNALYEATVFAADNNALEIRSLERSGKTMIKEVELARKAFLEQDAFVDRGCWDRYLFDGDMRTGFWPTHKYALEQRIKGGCFRLDLGDVLHVDSIVFRMNNTFSMEPLLIEEGVFADISSDLKNWETITMLSGTCMTATINDSFRYFKMSHFPQAISEIEVYADGNKINDEMFRVNNLFADSKKMKCEKIQTASFVLDEIAANSYLSVALNGEHGVEGAYVALKIDGKLVGSPSRAVSYPSNTWEYVNSKSSSNYTYYFPLKSDMKNKKIEVFVLGYDKDNLNFKPEVWLSAYPVPYVQKKMVIYSK